MNICSNTTSTTGKKRHGLSWIKKQNKFLGLALLFVVSAAQAAPISCEFHANSYTTGNQFSATTAMSPNGSMVVVWEGEGAQDSQGIYAQRYSKTGAVAGTQFLVNTSTTGSQYNPTVAMADNGDFVIAWQGTGIYGYGHNYFAQRYDKNGIAQGSEIVVSTTNQSGILLPPKIAMNSNGDFTIVWNSYESNVSSYLIRGVKFNALGVQLAQESVLVQTGLTISDNNTIDFAMDATGNSAITFADKVQRFNAQGIAQGSAITTGLSSNAVVDMDAAGNFVIADGLLGGDASSWGVRARKFDNTGAPVTGVLSANTYTVGPQLDPSVVANNDGTFVVVWQSDGQDGSNAGVYGQKFTANGVKSGYEFRANAYTVGDQTFGMGNYGDNVASDKWGNIVIVWNSLGQESANNWGIYGKRMNADGSCYSYVAVNNAPVFTTGNTSSVYVSENTTLAATATATDEDDDDITYSIAGGADAAKFAIGSSTGVLSFNDAPLYAVPADEDGNNIYTVVIRATDNGTGNLFAEQTINVTVTAPLTISPLPFNGTNQFVSIPANPAFEFTTGTIEMSVKPDWAPGSHGGANPCLIAERSFSGTRYSIHFRNDLSGIGIWNGEGWQTVNYNFARGEWAHVACVMTTSNTSFYVNGVFIGQTTNGINTNINDLDLTLGNSVPAPGDEAFEGSVNEVRIWNTARTPGQIAGNLSAEIDPSNAGLVAYYPVAANVVSSDNEELRLLKDSSAAQLNGTLYHYFLEDLTPPEVTGVENGGTYNSDRTITFNEGTATLDGEDFENGSAATGEGQHTLVVKDEENNTTTIYFTIDTTAPIVFGVSENDILSEGVSIFFEDGTATLNGDPFYSGMIVSEPGTYKLEVTDFAGNTTTVNFSIVGAITVTEVQAGSCANDYASVSYTSAQNFNFDNVFTIELSDANGSFAQPVAIGTYAGTATGAFIGHYPAHLAESDNYRVRVSSSSPAIVGTESAPITLHDRPAAPEITGSVQVNSSKTYTYSVPYNAGSSYEWSIPANYFVNGNTANVNWFPSNEKQPIQVVETNAFGCRGDGAKRLVKVYEAAIRNINVSNLAPCPGSDITVTAHVKGAYHSSNVFVVELSDKNGAFEKPATIGKLKADYIGKDTVITIAATIPKWISNGTNYRVRILAENGTYVSMENDINMVIDKPRFSNNKTIWKCENSTVDLTNLFPAAGFSATWNTATPAAVTEQGMYNVAVTNANGCTADLAVEVKNYSQPVLGNDTTLYVTNGSTADLTTLYNTADLNVRWNTPTPENALPGNYRLIAGKYGCRDTVMVKVINNYSPAPRPAASQVVGKSSSVIGNFSASLYPNPATSATRLSVTGAPIGYTITITNMSGSVIWQKPNLLDANVSLPLVKMAPGMYMVTVNSGSASTSLKLIKL